jgi:hypothetical protein
VVTIRNNEFANGYANLLNGAFLSQFDLVVAANAAAASPRHCSVGSVAHGGSRTTRCTFH